MAERDAGDYIGYTESVRGKPTLYFTNGRYTQVHDNKDNVGWHPIKKGRSIIRHNITTAQYDEYKAAKAQEKKKKTALGFYRRELPFIKLMLNGTYKAIDSADRLLEIQVEKNPLGELDVKSFHPSRSKLIKRGSKGCIYLNTYARLQLKQAKVAKKDEDTEDTISYTVTR